MKNKARPGTIAIEKNATPESSQIFDFTGSLGPFTLVHDCVHESASRTFTGLTAGTYTVSELVPEDWELTGITCDPGTAVVISGMQVRLTLAPGGAVDWELTGIACTPEAAATIDEAEVSITLAAGLPLPAPITTRGSIRRRRTPRGHRSRRRRRIRRGRQPRRRRRRRPLLRRPPSSSREEGASRRARRPPDPVQADRDEHRVGHGEERADGRPPAGGRSALRGLRASRRARLARGYAIWRLGRLAPGAKRTVRGSVRIKAGTPGWKRNVVWRPPSTPSSVNDRADTRIRARRQAPPVTGLDPGQRPGDRARTPPLGTAQRALARDERGANRASAGEHALAAGGDRPQPGLAARSHRVVDPRSRPAAGAPAQ